MSRMLRRSVIALAMLLSATAASAQIISTSLPTMGAGGAEKKVAYHFMAGYAKWKFA